MENKKVKCQRCGKEINNDEVIKYKIHYRDKEKVYNEWKKRYENKSVLKSYIGNFCSGECAANEQFANEG